MLYKYTDKKGATKLVEANHKGHAAQFLADTEYGLAKVEAAEAIRLHEQGVEKVTAPAPKGRG